MAEPNFLEKKILFWGFSAKKGQNEQNEVFQVTFSDFFAWRYTSVLKVNLNDFFG